jgi:peptidoglycan/xylan/chitin deacetylase (PgdA/CDA1 family)
VREVARRSLTRPELGPVRGWRPGIVGVFDGFANATRIPLDQPRRSPAEGPLYMHRVHRLLGRCAIATTGVKGGFASRSGLTILGWHRIGVSQDGLTTTPSSFSAQLDCLGALGANVLPLGEAVEALTRDSLPERAVALTFDDGYASVGRRAWPVLKGRGLPATLFVVPGYMSPGKYFPWDTPGSETLLMDSKEVRDLCADGLDIQSHSMTHRWLPGGDDGSLLKDLVASREALEDLLAKAVRGFAYPTGGWNPRVRTRVREAGYEYAVTVDRGLNRPGRANVHSLRRAFVPDSATDLAMLLDGGFDHLRAMDWLRRYLRMRSRAKAGW